MPCHWRGALRAFQDPRPRLGPQQSGGPDGSLRLFPRRMLPVGPAGDTEWLQEMGDHPGQLEPKLCFLFLAFSFSPFLNFIKLVCVQHDLWVAP